MLKLNLIPEDVEFAIRGFARKKHLKIICIYYQSTIWGVLLKNGFCFLFHITVVKRGHSLVPKCTVKTKGGGGAAGLLFTLVESNNSSNGIMGMWYCTSNCLWAWLCNSQYLHVYIREKMSRKKRKSNGINRSSRIPRKMLNEWWRWNFSVGLQAWVVFGQGGDSNRQKALSYCTIDSMLWWRWRNFSWTMNPISVSFCRED